MLGSWMVRIGGNGRRCDRWEACAGRVPRGRSKRGRCGDQGSMLVLNRGGSIRGDGFDDDSATPANIGQGRRRRFRSHHGTTGFRLARPMHIGAMGHEHSIRTAAGNSRRSSHKRRARRRAPGDTRTVHGQDHASGLRPYRLEYQYGNRDQRQQFVIRARHVQLDYTTAGFKRGYVFKICVRALSEIIVIVVPRYPRRQESQTQR